MGGFVSKWFFTVSRLVLKKEILDRDFFPDFPRLSMCFRGPQGLVETVGEQILGRPNPRSTYSGAEMLN